MAPDRLTKNLEPPDVHFMRAALGWAELGNLPEAQAELARIRPAHREHPDVLEVQWQLSAREKQWDRAVEWGARLVELAPESPSGWLHRSFALHELRRTEEAYQLLAPAADVFAEELVVAYNLACYTCQLGRPAECWRWLDRALRLAGRARVKAMALADPDLAPLHAAIAEKWT